MSAKFFDIMKYAATGIASPSMTAFDKMLALSMDGAKVQSITGVPPISFKGNGTPLISWSMLGNTVQNGTPTPTSPIPVQGVGDRTANLFDISTVEKGRIDNGDVGYISETSSLTIDGGTVSFTTTAAYRGVCSGFFEIPDGTETITFDFIRNEALGVRFVFYDSSKAWLNQDYIPTLLNIPPATANVPSGAKYVRLSFTGQIAGGYSYTMSNLMLNIGSTALPYEPYGYKVTITNNGTAPATLYIDKPFYGTGTNLDYLQRLADGSGVEHRAWRELVLTGAETAWYYYENATGTIKFFYVVLQGIAGVDVNSLVNTHGFNTQEVAQASGNALIRIYAVSDSRQTVEEWKAYLAAQYAAGTPVTVLYQLATPTDTPVTLPAFATAEGTNVFDTNTTVKPSSMSITGKIKPVT